MKTFKQRFIISLVIPMISMMAFISIDVHGKPHEEKQLEDFIKGNNYISAEKAILQFEQMYEKKVSLPTKLPFEPSHRFGTIDEEGRLKLHYMRLGKVNEYPTLDFIFSVMNEGDLNKWIKAKDKRYKLHSGEIAYYQLHHEHFHSLAFTKNGFGYHFGGDPKKVCFKTFINVAESIK